MYLHAVRDGGHGHHVDESLLILIHGGPNPIQALLPAAPWGSAFRLLFDSAWPRPPQGGAPPVISGTSVVLPARSLRVYGVVPVRSHEAAR
jgi:glycogen operon protein